MSKTWKTYSLPCMGNVYTYTVNVYAIIATRWPNVYMLFVLANQKLDLP